MYGSVSVSFNAGAIIIKFFRQVMYKMRTLYISVQITTNPFSLPGSCHLFSVQELVLYWCSSWYQHNLNQSLGRYQNNLNHTNFTMLFVPCMSTSWSNTMHILIQSNYITICSGGGHRHHQGWQHQKRERKKLLEGIYLVMHMWPYVVSSFNTELVYVSLSSLCEINKLGVEGGLKM